jgi:hypothetical protein
VTRVATVVTGVQHDLDTARQARGQ